MVTTDMSTPPDAAAGSPPGFRRMFGPRRLTLGLFFPIEAFDDDRPTMAGQEALAVRAEAMGFAALWFRDVPLRDPGFGDIGQVFDPWVYLSHIAAHTHHIALATGAIVLPLRHPLHTAKAAASVDRLSGGRLVLGVAAGDRAVEFPAFGVSRENRARLFRENLLVIRQVLGQSYPNLVSEYGVLSGADLVPKPQTQLPILVTGASGQSLEWIAAEADGWITYPRPLTAQARTAAEWRRAAQAAATDRFKPFAQSLYVDLSDDPDEPASPIHLGFRGGRGVLTAHLLALRGAGVHHVALNLKYGRRPASEVLEEIGQEVLPHLGIAEPVVAQPPPRN
jgi:luciferase-type oxidoreductase